MDFGVGSLIEEQQTVFTLRTYNHLISEPYPLSTRLNQPSEKFGFEYQPNYNK